MRSIPDAILLIVRELLQSRLGKSDVSLHTGDLLAEVGLTSFDMVSVVLAIEKLYRIKFPDEEIGPANFQNVNSIVAVTRRVLDSSGRVGN